MHIEPGDDITFSQTIQNGDETKYLQAQIVSDTGTLITSVDMDHTVAGVYQGLLAGGLVAGTYTVVYCSFDDLDRLIPSVDVGIISCHLCVAAPSDPSVINVNQLSPAAVEALLNLKGECEDINLAPGESKSILSTICDAVTGNPLDLTGCVVKFYVLPRSSSDIEDALIFKNNYPGGSILVPDPTTGEIIIQLHGDDTDDLRSKCYHWRVVISCPETLLGSGTADLTNATTVIEDAGVAVTWRDGDLFVLTSANAPNNGPFTVHSDEETGETVFDYDAWTTEALVPVEVYEANTMFPPGLCGKFNLKACGKSDSGYRSLG